MRKGFILLSAFVFVVGLCSLTWAVGVSNSKHDFRVGKPGASALTSGWGGASNQICVNCHVPHKTIAPGRYRQMLLWQQTVETTGATVWGTDDYWYTNWRYSAGAARQPDNYADLDLATRRCLGCHDGGNFVLLSDGSETDRAIQTGYDRFSDLREVHPVGVEYTAAAAELSADFRSQGDAVGYGIRFYDKTTGAKKASGASDSFLGCGSCHDPHNTVALTGGGKFIRKVTVGADESLVSSALCRACHKK